jgi:hypothetical protein
MERILPIATIGSMFIAATPTISVESASWGSIKALYR